MFGKKSVVCLSCFLLLLGSSVAADIYVPVDHRTIQEAIDASFNGDTIIVDPGTYEENIYFAGKAVTVKSKNGAKVTTIDGGQNGSVVKFISGEYLSSVLDGFTLTNGTGTYHYYAPLGDYFGGAIFCMDTSPTLINNIIEGNSAQYGGGIGVFDSYSPFIHNNQIRNNSATKCGGGFYCYSSYAKLTNNTFSGNSAVESGGGLCTYHSSGPIISNNTITENSAGLSGGGVFSQWSSTPNFNNVILWDNSAPAGPEIALEEYLSYGSALDIDYSNIQGGQADVELGIGCTLHWGSNNIDADPLFFDAGSHDFHISHGSPCKDVGSNAAPDMPINDFDGNPRKLFSQVDMGVDEYFINIYCSGENSPGGVVNLHYVYEPDATPVALFLSAGVYPNPVQTKIGLWYLLAPLTGPYMLQTVPNPGGIGTQSGTIPLLPVGPYSIYMQAFIGDRLSNCYILEIN